MADAHANLAISSVATAPSPASSGTSLVVATGEGSRFPATPFNATVWPATARPDPSNAEIVRVTARSTDTLTITRAQESSSARTIVAGDLIAATITAKSLTDIEVGTEYAFSAWKSVGRHFGPVILAGGAAGSTYLMRPNAGEVLAAANSAFGGFYLDPADYGAGAGRTVKFRLRGWIITNAVAPAVNFTFGLYPVATTGGASGAAPTIATLGTVVGATAAINAPAATSVTHAETTGGTTSAGLHVASVLLSGTTAANSNHDIFGELQYQQV